MCLTKWWTVIGDHLPCVFSRYLLLEEMLAEEKWIIYIVVNCHFPPYVPYFIEEIFFVAVFRKWSYLLIGHPSILACCVVSGKLPVIKLIICGDILYSKSRGDGDLCDDLSKFFLILADNWKIGSLFAFMRSYSIEAAKYWKKALARDHGKRVRFTRNPW